MAHILPETPPQTIPSEVLRVFHALKALPDTYFIWHHLAPWQRNAPDFLILSEDSRVLLVKVSLTLAGRVKPTAQLALIDEEREALGESEASMLNAFVSALHLPPDQALATLVVFPNIPDEQLQDSRLEHSASEPHWAGKELLQSEHEADWGGLHPSIPMDPLCLEKLRQRFTPEVVVPAEMTVRLPVERRLAAGLTDFLLDYSQELAVKSDLDLPTEAKSVTEDFRLNIINGVAGSGKTLILLYRLRLLYHLYPDKHFLVLTHNRPLIHDMQGRFARLEGHLPENIEWRTFGGWCYHHWPESPDWIEPISITNRRRLAEDAWREHLQGSNLSAQMLLSEIDWLKDQPALSRESYLAADRRGRGFRLNAEQRGRVYAALMAYQKLLKNMGTLDWGDVPQRIWKSILKGQMKLPEYDVVLVDEAQFFAPLWIQIIQKMLNPRNSHLFLVADPTQGFLGRGTTWKSLGLEARGRIHRLRRSYRTTREIMDFAKLLYRLRLSEEKDEDILAPDLLDMPNGAFPEIISLTSPQDEIARIANEVASFVKQGFPRGHLLLLHNDGQGVRALIDAVNGRLGKDAAIDPKDTYPGDYVRVTTLNAGAGLESPIVFLAGLQQLFEEEQSLRLSDDEREALIRDNTRKLYMAATRAGQRLVFTYVGGLPDALKTAFSGQKASL